MSKEPPPYTRVRARALRYRESATDKGGNARRTLANHAAKRHRGCARSVLHAGGAHGSAAAERTALIAKSNTLIRDRYPHSHALHQRCEKSYFGVFWDMAADAAAPKALACQARRAQSALPLQLHTFMDAAEVACRISGEEHDALAMRLKEEIKHARCSAASRPKRDRRGNILWQKTLPFASATLPETIACKARVFFAAVCALGSCDRRALQVHEKAFWTRHKRLCAAVGGAKHDRDDFCRVWLCLRKRLPAELSARVLRMAV